jgi:hypothetical protein
MKRMTTGLVMAVGLVALTPVGMLGQVGIAREQVCAEGKATGTLGISGWDCRGECTLTMNEKGEEQLWSFTVEPRITGITRGGPADGILRTDDLLVAIDGFLITTVEGGRRIAAVEPGQKVTVRFRRDGRLGEAVIEAGSVCPPPPPRAPEAVVATTRVPAPPPRPDEPRRSVGVAVSPRVRVAPVARVARAAEGVARTSRVGEWTVGGALVGASPTGRLGISFSCSECGTRTAPGSDEEVWYFSGPLEVTGVTAGGPADKAGIQLGDLIKAIDGKEIATEDGGLAFTRLEAGQLVRITTVKRNGSEVDVNLIPEGRRVVGIATVEPARITSETPPAPPAASRVVTPEPPVGITSPEGMPLRYSGAMDGVEVEVRGNPVTVSEMKGERTFLINAEGLWIRITLPRRSLPEGGDSGGGGSSIRR